MEAFFNFFFEIQFFVSLLISTLLFILHCPKKKYFLLKLLILAVVMTAVSTLSWRYAKSSEVISAISYGGLIICNFFFLAELMLLCFLCFKCTFTELCIFIVSGWTVQHMSGVTASLIAKLANIELNYYSYGWQYFVLTIVSYVVVFTTVYLLFRHMRKNSTLILNKRIYIPSIVILCVMVLLNIYSPYDVSLQGYIVMRLYALSCCFIMMFLIFSAFKEGELNYDIAIMEELDRKRSDQYELAKESIEVINTRSHDLKKLLNIITSSSTSVKEEEIRSIREEIKRFDSLAKTGNKAFDTIITEKSLYAERNGVKFTVLAVTDRMGFVSDIDVYSLFGNILDNAMEAVSKLDEDKRLVNLTVRNVNDFIVIHEENSYSGGIRFENENPVTTKEDVASHGYGVLSIKRIVNRYGGETHISVDDDLFNIDIVIPIRANASVPQIINNGARGTKE